MAANDFARGSVADLSNLFRYFFIKKFGCVNCEMDAWGFRCTIFFSKKTQILGSDLTSNN